MKQIFKNSSLILAFALVGFCAAFYPATTWADDLTADLVKITTPTYHADFSQYTPRLGEYEYEVGWEGIPAAHATIKVEEDGSNYLVSTSAQTASAIDILYELRYQANATLSAKTLLPVRTEFNQRENSRVKVTSIKFDADGSVTSVRSSPGSEPVSLKFEPENFMLDPFSAAFIARGLTWSPGESKQFDTFNGKSRYLITLTAVAKETLEVLGKTRDVWVISPKVQNLTNPANSKKLREAKIYVTADEAREIVKITSTVFIGSVYVELVSYKPSEKNPGLVIASSSSSKRSL